MEIKFLSHNQINKEKWDAAIDEAINGIIYAKSWYLDIVSPDWTALILGDYEVIMPLTYRKKFGVKYLYKPFFAQYLGVFFKTISNSNQTDRFIQEASKYFNYIDIKLNPLNKPSEFKYYESKTQVLDLSLGYKKIFTNYSKSIKNNISNKNDCSIVIEKKPNIDGFIQLLSEMYIRKKVEGYKSKDLEDLKNIMNNALNNDKGEVFSTYINDKLCATAFFLTVNNRSIIYTATNLEGRDSKIMFRIIDQYIQEHAGQDIILDFAGSENKGIAQRNLGYGADSKIYYGVKINNLPLLLKWMKK